MMPTWPRRADTFQHYFSAQATVKQEPCDGDDDEDRPIVEGEEAWPQAQLEPYPYSYPWPKMGSMRKYSLGIRLHDACRMQPDAA